MDCSDVTPDSIRHIFITWVYQSTSRSWHKNYFGEAIFSIFGAVFNENKIFLHTDNFIVPNFLIGGFAGKMKAHFKYS